jgi:hypothetical protein
VQRLLLSPAEVSHVAGTIVVRAVRVVVPPRARRRSAAVRAASASASAASPRARREPRADTARGRSPHPPRGCARGSCS